MIQVCDAIMGQGKSSSAITYMNEHADQKFIYIAPYLDEARRIKERCPDLHFVEPDKDWAHGSSKVSHTQELVIRGHNIATTHQAFKMYTSDMLVAVREQEYTLIIDESVELLEECEIAEDDLQLLVDGGYVKNENGIYTLVSDNYKGTKFQDTFRLLRSRQIMKANNDGYNGYNGDTSFFYWILSPELVTSFKDVFILTYLFEGQSMFNFLEMYNIPYVNIGVSREENDGEYTYRFCDHVDYIPEYVDHIKDMIDIIDSQKLNDIGEAENALSVNWFKNSDESTIDRVKNNIYNVFRNIWNESRAADRIWTTFKDMRETLKGRGYKDVFTVFNQRATNEYRDKLYLAYICNVYMNVNEKKFFYKHGLTVNEETYALSMLVQWIWRSAIRDGQKIYLYLPSSRMRRILYDWMDSLEKGGVAH